MNKLKIVIISVARSKIPPEFKIIDGIAKISSILAENLKKNGHEITFFVLRILL